MNPVLQKLQQKPWLTSIAILPIWLVLPMFLDGFTVSQLSLFSCYGLLAMSLALIWGQVGLLCLGQAIFFGIGAYSMGFVSLSMVPMLSELTQTAGSAQWVGLLLAVVIPMAVAYCMSLLLFNGRRLDGAYLGLVTLALAVIAERFFENWRFAGGSNGLMGISPLSFNGSILSETAVYYVMFCVVVLVGALLYKIKYSSFGLVLQAIADNETRTQHLGVNTKRIKTQLFVFSAGIAGLAGALFATQLFFVSPKLIGFALSTEVLIWVAVGGRFSFTAAFLGAVFVRLLENQLGDTFTQYWQLVLGLVFIAVVLFFPKGLFGRIFK